MGGWHDELIDAIFTSGPDPEKLGIKNYGDRVFKNIIALRKNRGIDSEHLYETYKEHGGIEPLWLGADNMAFYFKPIDGIVGTSRVISPFTKNQEPYAIPIANGNNLFRFPDQGMVLNTVNHRSTDYACSLCALWSGIHEGRRSLDSIAQQAADIENEWGYSSPGGPIGAEEMFDEVPVETLEEYVRREGFRTSGEDQAFWADIRPAISDIERGIIAVGPGDGRKHVMGIWDGELVDYSVHHFDPHNHDLMGTEQVLLLGGNN